MANILLNNLPYPAISGQIILAKNNCVEAPTANDMEWKDLTPLVGTMDLRATYKRDYKNREYLSLEQLQNGSWLEVAQFYNQISEEMEQKLRNLTYLDYRFTIDNINQKIIVEGAKNNADYQLTYEQVFEFDYITNDKLTELLANIQKLLNEKIEKETQERQEADNNIKTIIQEETQNRINADNNILTQLQEETTTRQNEDKDLYNQILNTKQELESKIIETSTTVANPLEVVDKQINLKYNVSLTQDEANKLSVDTEQIISTDTNNIIQAVDGSTTDFKEIQALVDNNTIKIHTTNDSKKFIVVEKDSLIDNDTLRIQNNNIEVDTSKIQAKLTAGEGINITNNTISATSAIGTGLQYIDTVYYNLINVKNGIINRTTLNTTDGNYSKEIPYKYLILQPMFDNNPNGSNYEYSPMQPYIFDINKAEKSNTGGGIYLTALFVRPYNASPRHLATQMLLRLFIENRTLKIGEESMYIGDYIFTGTSGTIETNLSEPLRPFIMMFGMN